MTPLPATRALDQYFLDARSKLLELAAILDRIERGADTDAAHADARAAKLHQAIEALLSDKSNKAEIIQHIFSQEYDPNWKRPNPRF